MRKPNWARGFIEALPGPASWTQWIIFAFVQTGNHETFLRQCLDNTANLTRLRRRRWASKHEKSGDATTRTTTIESPIAKVLDWEHVARVHHWLISGLYLFIIIKYRVLSLVGDRLGYLDCFIMGRFRYVGRTSRISGEVASVFIMSALLNRWTVFMSAPKFKFYALEFIMSGRKEVQRDETEVPVNYRNDRGANEMLRARANSDRLDKRGRRQEGPFDYLDSFNCNCNCLRFRSASADRGAPSASPAMDSIDYLRVPFDPLAHESKWILRPNRTNESRRALNLCTKVLFYLCIYVVLSWSILMYYLLSGSVVTNLGFEMAYPACVAWLRDAQANSSAANNYSHIYAAPQVLAHDRPIDDIPARIPLNADDMKHANFYTVLRIFMDILENHVIYLETMMLFCAYFYMLVINSIDVVLNAREIKKRLLGLIDQLEERAKIRYEQEAKLQYYAYLIKQTLSHTDSSNCNSIFLDNICHSDTLTPTWTSDHAHIVGQNVGTKPMTCESWDLVQNEWKLREEISDLQAILADHFDTITRGYNLYVSFILGFLGLCWLGYTVAVCVWMSLIRSRAVEIEFLLAELTVTLFCLALFSGAALVRSANLQLYTLITRTMALDSDLAATKPRWTSILKYFYPKPFHCFTLFGSMEISLLLGLKLISWILSAFIVLANFFYTNRF